MIIRKIGEEGVLTMICDSTNVFSPGRAGSESDVRKNLLKIIDRIQKRIIVTSFASNVARMETVFYCAEKSGRKISLVGRSMNRIYKAAKQKLRTLENFYDITGVFDSIDHTIYIDDHHMSDKGNRIVAKSIYDLLKRNLVGEIICN